MSKEIRQLVENFYDIQKIRVETFNRIVCWVKENRERIINELKSQSTFETQGIYASQENLETQLKYAIKLLEEAEKEKGMKKYSEFIKKFVLSHCKIETQGKYANLFKDIKNLIWFHNKLYETEKELGKRLDLWSKDHPLRKEFLNRVKGIGKVLSSGIIAWLSEAILNAEKVSSIWKYCGLYPGSERKRGKQLEYNLKLKTFCWKIGQSFIKYKCFGRKLYESFKEETKQKHPDWTKLHIHNYARRKVVKIFLACLWEKWRKMNNLTVSEPYPIQILGHTTKIIPEMWMEKKEE